VAANSTDLITNRRVITTVVQADPGEIVVLGGLIQEEVLSTEDGIPGLRNLPVAGRLFRSQSQERRRTNLMVFLRPTIVSTPDQARALTARQYDLLRMTPGIDPGILNRLEAEFRRSADGPSAALPVVREGVASGSWSPALGAPAAGATPAQ
jgi:general secretion pathway protein D